MEKITFRHEEESNKETGSDASTILGCHVTSISKIVPTHVISAGGI